MDSRKSESGQVAILFALVFTFLFILFGFVVDYANLVNNKINLQNAADAAAYAGAAYQAQTLNRLSMINYRLRQNTKELVMRVLVTHLRHNRGFPRGNGPLSTDGPAQVQPFMCQQAHGYVALSGLRYANDTNLCRNASPETGGLPPIVVPPVIASFDPFAVAIAAQIRRIAEASNQECRAAALDNRALAEHLIDIYTRRSQFHSQQAQSVESFLNSISQDAGKELSGDGAGIQNPIVGAAYQSAFRNLTLSNAADGFSMQVITPRDGEFVRTRPYNMHGSMFFFDFNVVGNGCVGRPGFIDFDNMVAGFSKDQAILTYFAVRLRSHPKMFFMPQSWVDAGFPELTAYAAAKPFGSRLGPDEGADELLPVPNRPGNINRMLNFSFVPGDQLGMRNQKMMAFFDLLHPFTNGPPDGNRNTGWPEPIPGNTTLNQALVAIRAPTVFDSLFYTIFPDPNRSSDYEESQVLQGGDVASEFYPDHLEVGDNAGDRLTSSGSSTSDAQAGGLTPAFDNIDSQGGAYGSYATEQLPSHSVAIAGGAGLPIIQDGNAQSFGFATRDMVHSGWSPQRDASHNQGRIGYSVKFISFDALRRTIQVKRSDTGQAGRIDNAPEIDDPNIDQIYH